MLVFTSICMNYLPKALTLGKSLKNTNKNVKFFIILLEREIPKEWPKEANKIVDKVILAKDLGFEDFDKFIFKHSIVEASTSVKGQALVHLLQNYDDKVLYIDPDIKIYSSLKELSDILDKHSIILTPHLTIPEKNEIDINNNELCALQHGVYNLGFVGVKNDEEGISFIETENKNSKININTATLEELDSLSGIGESIAQSIIDYREENGKFQTIEDLKNVSGIGEAKFEKIKENITVK